MNSTKKCIICGKEFYANYKGNYYCVNHLEMKLKNINQDKKNYKNNMQL